MILCLPPKRFEQVDDPRFDPIRHHQWFAKLDARRTKLPMLKAAYEAWKTKPQRVAAEMYGVDERELRDYRNFVEKVNVVDLSVIWTYRAVLDDAYGHYCGEQGKRHIRSYIETIAPFYGLKGRQVVEAWETDSCFYPTGYRP